MVPNQDNQTQDTPPRWSDGWGPAEPPPAGLRAAQGVAQVVVTAVLVAVAFAAGWFGNGFVNRDNVATGDQKLVLQAWDLIDQNFVVTGSIDHKKMAYAAIDAMVNSLGDTGHSRFETPEQFAQDQKDLQSAPTVGIGVLLSGGGDKPIRIEAIFPNSPASRSTLKAGDLIVGVNGTNVRGKTIDDARPLIAGNANTKVTLTIIRPSQSATATFDVTLTREKFSFPSVVSYIIPGVNVAYIHILEFTADPNDPSNTADAELQKAIKDAKAKNVTGIVLDLRDNPGGFLDQAQDVTSEFVAAGPGKSVLLEANRTSRKPLPVKSGGLATSIPLTILVNDNTASAAEIVAGAVAIQRPEVRIVGAKTFGTGTILQTYLLADGSALVLGTEQWLLPNGASVYHHGCAPDDAVALPDGVSPLSPLVAQQENLDYAGIKQSGDTQLVQAISILTGQSQAPRTTCGVPSS